MSRTDGRITYDAQVVSVEVDTSRFSPAGLDRVRAVVPESPSGEMTVEFTCPPGTFRLRDIAFVTIATANG